MAMAFIQLNIEVPKDKATFKGAPVTIGFKGTVGPLPEEVNKDTLLYYRWYSSSVARLSKDKQGNTKVDGYSMNVPALTNLDEPFKYALEMGSHVITFAVSDHPGETDEDFKAIQHGGVTGGRSGDHLCIIHVFKANIISPASDAHVLSSALDLIAEAPSAWGDKPSKPGEPEPYHEINHLAYQWKLEPREDPPGRLGYLYDKLGQKELNFNSNRSSSDLPAVSYTVVTPVLDPAPRGKYRITLTVLDNTNQKEMDSAFVDVTLE